MLVFIFVILNFNYCNPNLNNFLFVFFVFLRIRYYLLLNCTKHFFPECQLFYNLDFYLKVPYVAIRNHYSVDKLVYRNLCHRSILVLFRIRNDRRLTCF